MGGRWIGDLKVRVGRQCCISRGRPDGPSITVEVYQLEEFEEKVTVLVGVGPIEKEGSSRESSSWSESFLVF